MYAGIKKSAIRLTTTIGPASVPFALPAGELAAAGGDELFADGLFAAGVDAETCGPEPSVDAML